MPDSTFFIGRASDGAVEPLHYDPADLTTHAVVIGMTGSGKTGLLITLLEEAARQGLPAIIIDPKGDLTNLLLHFPQLRPADFAPWIDTETARRQSTTVEALAESTAARWREGLAEWGLTPADLAALRDRVDYTVFTPGSTAGEPVNLLSSFEAPGADWETNRETHRERVAATVTALLGLVGLNDVDPLRSREHILLSNIFENSWSQGQDLDLPSLIEQVQQPPFDRLGAFPLDRFFPEKDRFALALLLNNFLAAPSFQAWIEGTPLDAAELLYSPQGKPRFSIFYLAHLAESERMFFVTLLLASVESWMRSQRGSSGLRALLAFDEIVGYLPPVANPPSRPVLLRLLKQARAFGLGLMLATQNPSDLNYKALSNAGTWFIGRLQTERDKNRLLDGLQALDTGTAGGFDRAAFDRQISSLEKREFLLHNIHQPGPRTFRTRWVMNYLAGPLTRAQIPLLRQKATQTAQPKTPAPTPQRVPTPPPPLAFESTTASAAAVRTPASAQTPVPQAPKPVRSPSPPRVPPGSSIRPPLPPGMTEVFLPAALSLNRALAALGPLRGPLEPAGMAYAPALVCQAAARFRAQRYNVDQTRNFAALLPSSEPNPLDWGAFSRPAFDSSALAARPPVEPVTYLPLPAVWSTARGIATLRRGFLDWVTRTGTIYILTNEALGVYGDPGMPEAEYRRRLETAMRQGMQMEQAKMGASYDAKMEAVRRRIERQQGLVERREDTVDERKGEQRAADIAVFTGLLTGKKKPVSQTINKRKQTRQAVGALEEAKRLLDSLEEEWRALDRERQQAMDRIRDVWLDRAARVSSVPIPPLKKEVSLDLFAIAWLPVYRVQSPDGMIEAPAY